MSFKLGSLSIIVLMIGSFNPAFAQHAINGRIIDEYGAPLPYASIVLLTPADSTMQYFKVADNKGLYEIKGIIADDYLMQFSFATKETIYANVTIPADRGEGFGDQILKAAMREALQVVAEYIPIEIKQDTVAFNARAFKTAPGAVVEDLLAKIPGIEVDETGNVKALGENVSRVLVDGKEFFGTDPKVATKNLPAGAVEKVQVYDKRSEEAEFMGIDDGVRDRTINLLLNEDSKKGYFGSNELGGGTGEFFKTGGKIYRFSSNFQSALLGMYNNVNEFKFTGKNQGQFGQQVSGLNTTTAGGLNLSYNTEGSNRYFASYLVNSTKTSLVQKKSTRNYIVGDSFLQVEDMTENERNTPHELNVGVRHNVGRLHSMSIDGNLDMAADKLASKVKAATRQNGSLVNDLDNITTNRSELLNGDVRAVHIAKLNGDLTQVKTELFGRYHRNDTGLDWSNTTTIVNPATVSLEDQFQDNATDHWTVSVFPTIVQKVRPFWYLSAGVRIGSNNNALNRNQGKFRGLGTAVDSLSAYFETSEMFIKPSLSLRRSTAKSQVNLTLGSSWSRFDRALDKTSLLKSDYLYLIPGFNYSSNYRQGRRVGLNYSSSVNMPNVNQLLPFTNTNNQLLQYRGNADLKPEYRHNLDLSWSLFDHFSFTSLFTRVRGAYTRNRISLSRSVNSDFTQVISPVNIDGHYSAMTYISFSTPVRKLGLTLNAVSSETVSRSKSIINGVDNIETVLSHTVDLNIENRRKGSLDLRIGGEINVTDTRYSISAGNVFSNTKYYGKVRFTPSANWRFETDANVVDYNSRSFNQSVRIPLINGSISYDFLRGKKASFTLHSFDLLNRNTGFQRVSATSYLQEREWNTIGRYVMLTLNIRMGR